eukprot:363901-Chlamydomonas_euryale.AAC.13
MKRSPDNTARALLSAGALTCTPACHILCTTVARWHPGRAEAAPRPPASAGLSGGQAHSNRSSPSPAHAHRLWRQAAGLTALRMTEAHALHRHLSPGPWAAAGCPRPARARTFQMPRYLHRAAASPQHHRRPPGSPTPQRHSPRGCCQPWQTCPRSDRQPWHRWPDLYACLCYGQRRRRRRRHLRRPPPPARPP